MNQDRLGYFELADGGTLFLDEIADRSAAAQATLLRVLETRSFRWVGGEKEMTVKVRVVAATNRVLEDLVEAGTFRSDLMYRLNLYTIHLSPLRDRQEDILPLATHFLSLYATRRGLQFNPFSEDVQALVLSYDYPGNVRELRNVVERGMWNPSGPVCVTRYNRICRQPPLFPFSILKTYVKPEAHPH